MISLSLAFVAMQKPAGINFWFCGGAFNALRNKTAPVWLYHAHTLLFSLIAADRSIRQNWIPWFNQIWRGANYLAARRENLSPTVAHPASIHHISLSCNSAHLHAVYIPDLMNSRPRFEEIFSTLIWPPHNDNCCLPEYTKNKKLVGRRGYEFKRQTCCSRWVSRSRFSNIHNYASRVDRPTRGQFCDL